MYRCNFSPETTGVAFAGHGVNLMACHVEALRARYASAHNIFCVFEQWYGRNHQRQCSIEELLREKGWEHSSALYQMLKLAIDMAWLAALKDELGCGGDIGKIAGVMWGLSLGELEALTAAGVWRFEQALYILKRRGECIEAHQPSDNWDTHAFIGIAREVLDRLIHGSGTLSITNHNGEEIVLVGGARDALQELASHIQGNHSRVKINKKLSLGTIFHHPVLKPAADMFEKVIRNSSPRPPCIPVLSNVTGACHTTATIAELLGKHLIHPVELVKMLETLAKKGITRIIIIGNPGPLEALIQKRFETILVVNSPEALLSVKSDMLSASLTA